jgi:hypothetical protein
MGQTDARIDGTVQAFIEQQRMFFVATAPLDANGHVNVSPKGLDTFSVLTPTTVAYLDYVGSGSETIAHVKENGRIVLMWCAFEGTPKILRIHGRGEVLEPGDAKYRHLRPRFPAVPDGRSIIVVHIHRVSDSCGFGVPLYAFEGQRSHLAAWSDRKGAEGLKTYQREHNVSSVDGLPALDWAQPGRAADGRDDADPLDDESRR